MEIFASVVDGVQIGLVTALTPTNLMFCLLGAVLGMVVGVLPGIGQMAAMSMLFPITFYIDPTAALIMLAGIYYGTAYGGSVASILLNVPGTPAGAVAALDGFPLTQKGRAGVALFITTIASFIGGSIGILLMMFLSPVIVHVARSFSSAEYFSLMTLGLVSASTITVGSPIKGLGMILLGLAFSVVGMDMYSGASRFTFGAPNLLEGISIIVVATGLFGVAEVISSARTTGMSSVHKVTLRSMIPTREDWKQFLNPTLRGSGIGAFFGILPGTGALIASFLAYGFEKRISRTPEKFGRGAIEGISSPEAANNAADQTSFIPTLTLGIPGSATMAIMLGVLMIHGIAPGPQLITERPDFFWGLIMSFWIGNVVLVFLNIPFIGIWVRLLQVPFTVLFPTIIVFICVGVYSIGNNAFDVGLVAAFGLIGYFGRALGLPAAPFILGFVLGPLMEEHFRRAMILSRGSLDTFLVRPISAIFIVLTLLLIVWSLIQWLGSKKRPATEEA